MPDSWVCYLITSLDSNKTYIGASNNQPKRLIAHNTGKGAAFTRGECWIPIVIISGFQNKNEALSFEKGWQKLWKRRNNERLYYINQMSEQKFKYDTDQKWNRIMDLLFFVHNFTFMDTKFMINYDMRHPVFMPSGLTINIFFEDWICGLPWPYFINIKYINKKN